MENILEDGQTDRQTDRYMSRFCGKKQIMRIILGLNWILIQFQWFGIFFWAFMLSDVCFLTGEQQINDERKNRPEQENNNFRMTTF